jgi:hypothetical protein
VRVRSLTAFVAFAACGLGATRAEAALRVKLDCFLPSTTSQVQCPPLESALFSSPAYARANDASDGGADVAFSVRSIDTADGAHFLIEVAGKDPGMKFTYTDAVPKGFSNDVVLLRLVGDLEKLSAPFLVVDEPAPAGENVALVLKDPRSLTRKARDDDGSTGWYVAPSASFYAEQVGIFDVKGHANVDANWSTPDWRVQASLWSGYLDVVSDLSAPLAKRQTYSAFDAGFDGTVARSLYRGFSLGASVNTEHVPEENYFYRADAYVGAEWVLVPFLKTDEKNFGINWVVGAEHQQYEHTTVLDRNEFDWLRQRVKVFGAWHFDVVDLEADGRFASMVNDWRYSSLSGNASITWRLLDDLSLGLQGGVGVRFGMVEAPKNLDELNPLEQFYGGDDFGSFTFNTQATLTYTFGNSLLARQDQRWR